ncbi:Storage protein, partial [Zea mays]
MFVALGACAFVLIPVEYFLFGLAGGKLMERVRSLTFQSLMRQEISWFDKPEHSRWYAKQFLHPDIVARYDYIFIWDEDLGVEHFNAEAYIKLVRKHGLEISQPGLEPDKGLTWQMTKRRGDQEVHKVTEERPGWCSDPHLPPCAAFVEIMATVFSRDAWRCVWHMIQNDLVHGWGLDFALRKCVE